MDIQSQNSIPNKKNFESNKLINPDIIEENIDEDPEEDDGETSEMDDETLEIINRVRLKKLNEPNYKMFKETNKEPEKIEPKVNKKTKVKKSMSLQEFSKIVETENKPVSKRFTSNRVENKKKQNDSTLIPKRQFNPRKPPYNFIRKPNKVDSLQFNNIQEFPDLK